MAQGYRIVGGFARMKPVSGGAVCGRRSGYYCGSCGRPIFGHPYAVLCEKCREEQARKQDEAEGVCRDA